MDLQNISPVMWTIAALIALIILVAIVIVVGLKRKKANTISFEQKSESEVKTQKELSGNYQAKTGFNFAPATPKQAEPVLREGQELPSTPPAAKPAEAPVAKPAQQKASQPAPVVKPEAPAEKAPTADAAAPAEDVATPNKDQASEPQKVPAEEVAPKVVETEKPVVDEAPASGDTELVGMPAAEAHTTTADSVAAATQQQASKQQPAQAEPSDVSATNKAGSDNAAAGKTAAAGAAAAAVAGAGAAAVAASATASADEDAKQGESEEAENADAVAPEETADQPQAADAEDVQPDLPAVEEGVAKAEAAAAEAEAELPAADETPAAPEADEETPAGADAVADDAPAEQQSEVDEAAVRAEAEEAAEAADRSIDAAAEARATTPAPQEQAAPAPAPVVTDDIDPAEGRLGRLRGRLSRSQNVIGQGVLGILSAGDLDEDAWEEIEDTLLMADLGTATTVKVVDALREKIAARGVSSEAEARAMLRETLIEAAKPELDRSIKAMPYEGKPAVILVVGVNGTGKTTTTGKLARVLVSMGHKVILGAADTFRAAAADQLETWGRRVGAETVRGAEGADPASVAFDAVARGVDQGVDVVVVDTAGRLHTSVGLMDQLGKVKRVVEKKAQVDEVLLVLDATVGQNGLIQARTFRDVVDITGVVLTKLDGTAKGGIVFQVQEELGVPVKLVGLGEGADHLAPFEVDSFVDALLGTSGA